MRRVYGAGFSTGQRRIRVALPIMNSSSTSSRSRVSESELEFTAIRASGPGGQNVNKVSTAVQLRFNIHTSSLPPELKTRLLAMQDRRISGDGIVVLKAQRFRSQDKNKQDAIERLDQLIARAAQTQKKRVATKPGRAAKERRLKNKKKTGEKKSGRGSVSMSD